MKLNILHVFPTFDPAILHNLTGILNLRTFSRFKGLPVHIKLNRQVHQSGVMLFYANA